MSVIDTMDMGEVGTYESEWIEGVLIQDDGTLGDWFMEMDGVVTVMPEIEPDHFQYETAVTRGDLSFTENITMANMVTGVHLNDKVVTRPEGVEPHVITRTTTITYDPGTGAVTVEWTSLAGTHVKVE